MNTKLVSGAGWGLLTVLAERALTFALLLTIARVLEPERFGLYVYLLAGVMTIQVMADQGLETAAIRLMAERTRQVPTLFAAVLTGRVLLWMGVGLPVCVLVLPSLSGCAPATGALASLLILVGPSMSYRSVCRARGQMDVMWRTAVLDAAVGFACVAIVLAGGGSVAHVFAARAAASIAVSVRVIRRGPVSPRIVGRWRPVVRSLIASAWPLALNAAVLSLIVRLGHFVVMQLVGTAAVGDLGAAARVAEMISLLPEGVMLAAFPAMAARPRGAARVGDDVARGLGLVVGWVVAVCVGGAPPLVALLYGPEYAGAAVLLAILSWGALVSTVGIVLFYRLVVMEQQRLLLRVNVMALAVGLVLQISLVSQFGVVGAAVATVLTLVAGQLLLCRDRGARRIVARTWQRVLPTCVIAAGAVAAGHVLGSGWGALLVTAIAYPVGAVGAGLIGDAERKALGRVGSMVRARVADGDDER